MSVNQSEDFQTFGFNFVVDTIITIITKPLKTYLTQTQRKSKYRSGLAWTQIVPDSSNFVAAYPHLQQSDSPNSPTAAFRISRIVALWDSLIGSNQIIDISTLLQEKVEFAPQSIGIFDFSGMVFATPPPVFFLLLVDLSPGLSGAILPGSPLTVQHSFHPPPPNGLRLVGCEPGHKVRVIGVLVSNGQSGKQLH